MTLRQDLETLYHSLTQGWSQYGVKPDGNRATYGENQGCLGQQIVGVITQRCPGIMLSIREDHPQFKAMMTALGFRCASDLFSWNDHRDRTWQEVQDLVKNAIADAPIDPPNTV